MRLIHENLYHLTEYHNQHEQTYREKYGCEASEGSDGNEERVTTESVRKWSS